jgi:hypothetical protein
MSIEFKTWENEDREAFKKKYVYQVENYKYYDDILTMIFHKINSREFPDKFPQHIKSIYLYDCIIDRTFKIPKNVKTLVLKYCKICDSIIINHKLNNLFVNECEILLNNYLVLNDTIDNLFINNNMIDKQVHM